tara:strand:- start:74 stop:481 length:408 start_codon:yes stop_codon:yes gene_type:complete
MTRIESPVVALSAAPELVARDFQDWNTFGELLGAGPVSDFSSEGDTCTFKVTGGVAIHLLRTSDNSATTGTVLTLVTQAPTPVKFNLEVNVQPNGERSTCQVGCDADLNPFTKMMVEPALKGLFAQMAQTLQARY